MITPRILCRFCRPSHTWRSGVRGDDYHFLFLSNHHIRPYFCIGLIIVNRLEKCNISIHFNSIYPWKIFKKFKLIQFVTVRWTGITAGFLDMLTLQEL